jgi:GT2 family glycosyltransferase
VSEAGASAPAPAAPPPGRTAVARRVRDLLGPVSALPDPPPVSIVMLNRDGRAHLVRLVPLLESATDYPSIELIVVDNGSRDGSVEYLERAPVSYPVRVERNDENVSFSAGCNQGAALASFDHLLFLNNDVEPFDPGWLRELVAGLSRSGASAVGATLLHGAARPGEVSSGYLIQHQGVRFRRKDGYVTPINHLDASAGLERLGTDVPSPAVTAACMLIERSTLERVGGFTPGFHYGYEDVDLGLKLIGDGGITVCSGRSVLFHHESATRLATQELPERRDIRLSNQRLLMERWGPQLEREYMRDRLAQTGLWSERGKPEVALISPTDRDSERAVRELGDALEESGWEVAYVERVGDGWGEPPAGTDLLVVADHGYGAELRNGIVSGAWVWGDVDRWEHRPWLRRCQLVLAGTREAAEAVRALGRHPIEFPAGGNPDALARELTEIVESRNRPPRFCVKLPRGARRPGSPATLAGALRGELERRGHLCTLQLADEWERLDGLTADVAISFAAAYQPKPAQLNVLLLEQAPGPEVLDGRWDLVAVEDGPLAGRLGGVAPAPPLISLGLAPSGAIGPACERLLEALHAVEAANAWTPSIAGAA